LIGTQLLKLEMFKRSAETSTGEPTVIGKGSRVAGTLRVKGRVQIDGVVEGHVFAEGGHVSIGPTGSVVGELSAGELVVGGRIEGTVRVTGLVHVVSGGSATGVLQYSGIQVDRGGALEELSAEDLDKLMNGDEVVPSVRPSARVEL
jgi:cytoskeletal protein CcmA (bactofilin family)